jgi:FKBP-type peptidyl-prolyl cis-trans isomerase 2
MVVTKKEVDKKMVAKEKPAEKELKETGSKANKATKAIRNIYIVDYYIKDLNLGKVVESNLKEHKPMLLAAGQKIILEGIGSAFKKVEDKLRDSKVGADFKLTLEPKEAYGIRKQELLRVISSNDFKEHKINPFVGLQINADGRVGTVKTVSGGRVMIDFNSPFADHKIEVYYKLKELPKGNDKIKAFVIALAHENVKDTKIEKEKNAVKVTFVKEDQNNQIIVALMNATSKYYFENPPKFE